VSAVDHPVDSLLPDWGAWCRRENNSGLGYSQVQYAEMIARATSASEWNPHHDPRVQLLDVIIRTRLAQQPRIILMAKFVERMPDKTVAAKFSISRSHLNRMLHIAILPQLRHEWDCCNTSGVAQNV
jgi:hypothetical protein